jgi:hypothetical protein
MPPQFVSFPADLVRQVFARHHIYVVEEYPDGQVMWGTEPPGQVPYQGQFQMADYFQPGTYDSITLCTILGGLGKEQDEVEVIMAPLYDSILGEPHDD